MIEANEPRSIERIELPMYGEHNVLNSLAAIAISLEMGMHEDLIRVGLRDFKGVKMIYKTGICNGIVVIDDYAHHPVEILQLSTPLDWRVV